MGGSGQSRQRCDSGPIVFEREDTPPPPGPRGLCNERAYQDMEEHGPPIKASKGGLWPNAKVYYSIDASVEMGLQKMIDKAINDFHAKTPVRWIKNAQEGYYVEFKQNNGEGPHATVGCWQDQRSEISLPYPNYPESSSPLKHICVLHEMGHCIGLQHEHSRQDRDEHCVCETNDDHNFAIGGVPFGSYDYYSIMHYGHGAGLKAKNKELEDRADNGISFSAGDIAIIKKLYNGRSGHHGDWHRACGPSCTPTECSCGACGPLHGGVNCGYEGMKAHWTCCMSEVRESVCVKKHTGFWHAACGPRCTAKTCSCNNCGGGCTYEGHRAHWSCCNSESFESVDCSLSK